MPLTLADLLTSLAYRLGEDSSPDDATEKSRRVRFINEGYRKLIATQPMWFSETSTTLSSVALQETYTLPSDFRDIIELRVDNEVYDAISQAEVFQLENTDDTEYLYNRFYIYQNELHILPKPEDSGTNNIAIKYFKYPTLVSSDSDTFIIPDFYLDALVAYAYARINQLDDRRGDSADGFDEFNEIVRDLMVENNRQKFYNKSIRPFYPIDIQYAD